MEEEVGYEMTQEVKDQIRKWKEAYQGVYITEVSDVVFIWRGLTRAEYRKALELYDDDYERAEFVCETCVLDPADVSYSNEIYAGIPETLAENILRESGFDSDGAKYKELTRHYDQEMNRLDNQISCVIAEAFPYYRIEEIDNWSLEKTLLYFSRAKWILRELRSVELTEEGGNDLGLPLIFQ